MYYLIPPTKFEKECNGYNPFIVLAHNRVEIYKRKTLVDYKRVKEAKVFSSYKEAYKYCYGNIEGLACLFWQLAYIF